MPSEIHHTLNLESPTVPTEEKGVPLSTRSLAADDVTSVQIRYSQRIAAHFVSAHKPSLEVHRPHVIGPLRPGQFMALALVQTRAPAPRGGRVKP